MFSPEELVRSYREAVAAAGRGRAEDGFDGWLESFWTPTPSPEPAEPPDAVSFLGGVSAVRWYGRESAIVGYPIGRSGGCYVVPRRRP